MRYYKMIDADGNLTAIGTGTGGVEITAEEYAALSEEIAEKAALVASLVVGEITETDIRDDWREEIVRRAADVASINKASYTREVLETMTDAELESVLGGMEISTKTIWDDQISKTNMIALILALQSVAGI